VGGVRHAEEVPEDWLDGANGKSRKREKPNDERKRPDLPRFDAVLFYHNYRERHMIEMFGGAGCLSNKVESQHLHAGQEEAPRIYQVA